tara:strand:- start:438 stop:626 length:189 start_codon:yes stop_codon:yes gene_type:complete
MYEIQESNNVYNVFDTVNQTFVGYTKNKKNASRIVKMLKSKGFKGNVPAFFWKNKINFDPEI